MLSPRLPVRLCRNMTAFVLVSVTCEEQWDAGFRQTAGPLDAGWRREDKALWHVGRAASIYAAGVRWSQ